MTYRSSWVLSCHKSYQKKILFPNMYRVCWLAEVQLPSHSNFSPISEQEDHPLTLLTSLHKNEVLITFSYHADTQLFQSRYRIRYSLGFKERWKKLLIFWVLDSHQAFRSEPIQYAYVPKAIKLTCIISTINLLRFNNYYKQSHFRLMQSKTFK